MSKLRLFCAILLIVASSACSTSMTPPTSAITIERDSSTLSQRAVSVAVRWGVEGSELRTLEEPESAGNNYCGRSATCPPDLRDLQHVASIALRSALLKQGDLRIYDTLDRITGDGALISATITEYVVDLDTKSRANEQLGMKAGNLVTVASSLAGSLGTVGIPIIGGVLPVADTILGVPQSWRSADKIGVIAGDISIIDKRSGIVLSTLPFAGQFRIQMKQMGEDYAGTYSKRIEKSTPRDALRTALAEAAPRIKAVLLANYE